MSKVIRITTPNELRRIHTQCGALIEYTAKEVKREYEPEPFGGGKDYYYYLLCPHCNIMMRWSGGYGSPKSELE